MTTRNSHTRNNYSTSDDSQHECTRMTPFLKVHNTGKGIWQLGTYIPSTLTVILNGLEWIPSKSHKTGPITPFNLFTKQIVVKYELEESTCKRKGIEPRRKKLLYNYEMCSWGTAMKSREVRPSFCTMHPERRDSTENSSAHRFRV